VRIEELRPLVAAVGQSAAAVQTPVDVLGRMGFFEGGGTRLVFYRSHSAVRAARRALKRLHVAGCHVLVGSLSGLPVERRSLGLVVAPLPRRSDPDLLRSLRRTAGVLGDGGIVVLYGRVRRNPVGWALHVADVILRRAGGLPSEADLCSWVLRGGFRRIVSIQAGRIPPVTVIHAVKSLP